MWLTIGTSARPCVGHRDSGDEFAIHRGPNRIALVLLDVLGHGDIAHRVALTARAVLKNSEGEPALVLLANLDVALRTAERGAGGAVLEVLVDGTFQFFGVGNVAGRHFGAGGYSIGSLSSVPGTLGAGRAVTPPPVGGRLREGEVLAVYTDGVSDRLVATTKDLVVGRPDRAARRITHYCGKLHDDATCIVARYGAP